MFTHFLNAARKVVVLGREKGKKPIPQKIRLAKEVGAFQLLGLSLALLP
jgi:hypothetical protein